MSGTSSTAVLTGLRIALHIAFYALVLLVLVRAVLDPVSSAPASRWAPVLVSVALMVLYTVGPLTAPAARRGHRRPMLAWLVALTVLWAVLLWLRPEAAYLVFPLFFLYLHLLGARAGGLAVLASTVLVVLAIGVHGQWTVGGVVGPLIGAAVALMIGLGYRVLSAEAAERERLVAELLAAQGRLAATERETGRLTERARLAREIHDTVAQGLSSIQMLLHAAERVDPAGPGVEHIRLARSTAADSLADARRFIRELTPARLEEEGLGAALRRLAAEHWAPRGLDVHVHVADDPDLSMRQQTALLRVCQGAMANVLQHAEAGRADIDLTCDDAHIHLEISDDGRGFDPALQQREAAHSDSFGLSAARERVEQLGGTLRIVSSPGAGTRLIIDLQREESA